jgi:hypothetical protein
VSTIAHALSAAHNSRNVVAPASERTRAVPALPYLRGDGFRQGTVGRTAQDPPGTPRATLKVPRRRDEPFARPLLGRTIRRACVQAEKRCLPIRPVEASPHRFDLLRGYMQVRRKRSGMAAERGREMKVLMDMVGFRRKGRLGRSGPRRGVAQFPPASVCAWALPQAGVATPPSGTSFARLARNRSAGARALERPRGRSAASSAGPARCRTAARARGAPRTIRSRRSGRSSPHRGLGVRSKDPPTPTA